MTETLKKGKSSDFCVPVGESDPECIPESSSNFTQTPVVKKRKRYTFEDKQKILEELKNLTSHEICTKYGMSDRVLRKWKLNKNLIEDAAKKESTKTLKKVSKTEKLDAELFEWFDDCRRNSIPVSGPMLCRQALVINTRIGGSENFKASNGWLDKWKKRTHIKDLAISGETLSADEEAANLCRIKLAELVAEKKLDRAQILNTDESGLKYKINVNDLLNLLKNVKR
ncbi:jerky protein homolog-like [Diprion similis]|uniref:jerky protein homolog-like n=1 Tax=Diprion similis TaxID=362088 RepID=UPI001EF85C98|nr:jerky protein homolog-like [Diprion similis]